MGHQAGVQQEVLAQAAARVEPVTGDDLP